jgi:hypothetical protein
VNDAKGKKHPMNKQMKNAVRGVMVLVLTAAVTWLANYLVDRIFGPDEIEA